MTPSLSIRARYFLPTLFWGAATAVELYLRRTEPGYWNADFTHAFVASLLVSFGLFHGITGILALFLSRFPRLALLPSFLFGLIYSLNFAFCDGVRIVHQPLPTPIKFATALLAEDLPRAFVIANVTPIFWGGVVGVAVFSAFLYLRILLSFAPQKPSERPAAAFVILVAALAFLGGFPFVLDGAKSEYLPMIGEVHTLRFFRVGYRFAHPPQD